ncbi:MAG: histidinol phosphate phosphatase domain-containing protein [Methanomicrobiales archaeon]|nr:histidinol phosphate phosphatase domain-containing protein [Methanomicrobiales archaeon]MDD1660642.1 histidinol phosphate phosphatase domain-containing protein [Methanomicrobiales archaeon]
MKSLYDLHTHSLLSDGEMLPIELIRRASVLGYTTLAIADHVDHSNLSEVIAAQQEVKEIAGEYGLTFLCGVEITHVPPTCIPGVARRAKEEGAEVVVVHGETVVEPVAPGTNHAACTCNAVDVLAHPGLITLRDAREAAKRSIALEITSRAGHNRTNGHVAAVAREARCILVVDSDAHGPHDLLPAGARRLVARGAGLSEAEARNSLGLNISSWLATRPDI